EDEIFETVIDPTRGQLLALATEAPSLMERIDQGSTVGYLIILLGLVGLGFAGYRGYNLVKIDLALTNQEDNSIIVRLQAYYKQHQSLSLDQMELRIEEFLSRSKTRLESGLAMIKLLAAVSPLMGLLGTVTGMIATFSAITLFGTGDPKLMAGGISQALITTVEGLIVAIPLLFAYTMLNSRSKVIMAKLEEEALHLLSQHK
ncbi:MAG: MotA/TolQ/ExbB proton channel family protein, partial [Thiovulaceae bacterium]|nr:MotA/TolQ/ExbB proton channel family protein [Sulfurimonadaceae bacterium]